MYVSIYTKIENGKSDDGLWISIIMDLILNLIIR
jgi:hypothetical protein